jgi:hypothetical protein
MSNHLVRSPSADAALDKVRVVTNAVAIPVAIAFNYLGSAEETRVVARDGEPLLAAAGWGFAIWSFIFAGQLGYAIYQAFPSQHARPLHRRIGWLTAANGVLGALWIFAFTERAFTAAWAIMIALLAVLGAIEISMRDDARSKRDYWLVRFTYSLNFGWISVATILNTTQWLAVEIGYDAQPLGPVGWSVLLIGAACAIGVAMIVLRNNIPFALATAWGLFAIAAYRWEVEALSVPALAGAIALIAISVFTYFFPRRGRRARNDAPLTSPASRPTPGS